jgi:hypothetical protein
MASFTKYNAIIYCPFQKACHLEKVFTFLDQCCTDTGLISWELAKMLQLPTTNGVMAARTFTADKVLQIKDTMLPCLSTNCTFSINLMVIPEKCIA